MNRKLGFALAVIPALILSQFANAADTSFRPPSSTSPDVLSTTLPKDNPARQTTKLLPPIAPQENTNKTPLSADAQKITFKLTAIKLKGNTIFTDKQIAQVYQQHINKTITVVQLFNIVQDITNFYRNSGYILSRAILPPQKVNDGRVTIQVVEGFLAKVAVAGKPYRSKLLVERYGEKMIEQHPLQIQTLEKYLILANEIPGTQVRTVFAPSKDKTGAADLNLIVDNKPLTGYLSYDNYGTRYIGPQNMTANVTANSLITSGDATSVTVIKTPKGGELSYADVNYNFAVGNEGVRWTIGGTRVQTHPLFVLEPTQIDGLNSNLYTMMYFPLIRSRSQSLTLRAGFNYMDSYVTILDTPLYTDHLRNLDLGFSFNNSDRWLGMNAVSADLRQGLPILGCTSDTNPNTAATSRPSGRADYTKITTTLSRVQAIRGAFSMMATVSGQWAFSPVLASEQFSYGGSQMGRGYDAAEIVGDRGAAGSIEARYDMGFDKWQLRRMQFYVFYDAGLTWNYRIIGGIPYKQSATSAGIGTRFYFSKYISGNFMWTKPLTRKVAAEALVGKPVSPRVFFSIVAMFN